MENIKSKRGYQSHGQQSKKITIRVPKELLESFDEQARKRGNNRSEVILHLMNAWLKA